MKRFSALLESLYYEHSNLGKEKLLCDYFSNTPDPDRGYALAIIAGTLEVKHFKRGMVLDLITQKVDPTLLEMSYDYVGELSETVAHLWPGKGEGQLPLLHQVVERLQNTPKEHLSEYIAGLLDCMTSPQRWALLKIGTGSLRIGVSARFVKQVLAKFGNKNIEEIESIWHGIEPPYLSFFAWLEGKAEAPEVTEKLTFTPVMLAHALEEKDYHRINPTDYAAEWKYDGIRVQLVHNHIGKALFTRTGDDIGHAFPDVLQRMNFHGTIDGELLVSAHGGEGIGSFNELQQRLGRKAPSKQLIEKYPTRIMAYDMLVMEGEDVRGLPYTERRRLLQEILHLKQPEAMSLSPQVEFADLNDLAGKRAECEGKSMLEGLMLKRKDASYVAGRPTGPWWKWKIEPRLVDAVLMYAQRGSGKRSSFYSDYTFGLWKDEQLLPIGKAYFGFTDEELKELDKWVRHHTTNTFGPVREVEKELVFEVAFDAVHRSTRHKSGYALRFPRINRIRWDKPADEADDMRILEGLLPTR